MALHLSDDEILERSRNLPAFPKVVGELLDSLDDEQATIGTLVHHVERDPVITAHVVSLASQASSGRTLNIVRDVRTALSMIGLSHVREIVMAVSLAEFNRDSRMSSYFWEHSVAVGVCAQELGRFTHVSLDYALVAGLLHDIGQLWMARFYPLEFKMVRMATATDRHSVIDVEQHYFGTDHCAIGRLLAAHWQLPESVVEAVALHHDPDEGLDESLVVVTHVAEVLSNALDLTQREGNLVAGLSEKACDRLGLDWSQDLNYLFGKIEARVEYACRVFR
jgi:HD-like signal output (HDOD) protein